MEPVSIAAAERASTPVLALGAQRLGKQTRLGGVAALSGLGHPDQVPTDLDRFLTPNRGKQSDVAVQHSVGDPELRRQRLAAELLQRLEMKEFRQVRGGEDGGELRRRRAGGLLDRIGQQGDPERLKTS